jgi:hypothetical protein
MHSTAFQLFTETYLNVCVDFVKYRQTFYNVNIYLILLTNVAGDTILKSVGEIDLNTTI